MSDFKKTVRIVAWSVSILMPMFVPESVSAIQRWPLRNGTFSYYQGWARPANWTTTTVAGQYNIALDPAPAKPVNPDSNLVFQAVTPGKAYSQQQVDLPDGNYIFNIETSAPDIAIAMITAGTNYQTVSNSGGFQAISIPFQANSNGLTGISISSNGGGTVKFRNGEITITNLVSSQVPASSGEPFGAIVVGANPSEAEKYAAFELQRYIYRITGHTVGLLGRDEVHTGRRIFIGTAAPDVVDELGSSVADSYAVRLQENNLILAGNTPAGSLYAVYDFLKYQGCGWFMPGEIGEVVPSKTYLNMPTSSKIETPDYDVRGMFAWTQHFYPQGGWIFLNIEDYFDWCVRNRINALWADYSKTADFLTYRGSSHIQTTNHSWATFLLDNHPEWWPLVNGQRLQYDPATGHPNQLCVSNQALRDYVVNYICTFFAQNPNAAIFGLNEMDSLAYWCECQFCRALDSDLGTGPWIIGNGLPAYPVLSMSDRSLNFVKEVAARVCAVYPGKKIEMYAYAPTHQPPTRETVPDNVEIRYTWHGSPVSKSILDANIPFNAATINELDGWKNAGVSTLGIYDYGNWYHMDSPNFWFAHTVEYLKAFNRRWNVRFWLGEDEHGFRTSFMWYNLRARCFWNTDVNSTAEINDICTRFYGPSAQKMIEYYRFMENIQLSSSIWQATDAEMKKLNMADYTAALMQQGKTILDQAAQACSSAEYSFKERVDLARFGHAFMTIEIGKNENPLSNSSKKIVGDAFNTAKKLASEYYGEIMFASQASINVLNNPWFMPFGQIWDRSVDWTDAKNPDDDSMGNNVWNYETVARGNPLGQTSPWYQQNSTSMLWSTLYWKANGSSAPRIYKENLENFLGKSNNPMVRWANSSGYSFTVNAKGTLTIKWGPSCSMTDVDVVVAHKTASTGASTVLEAKTVVKPTSVVNYETSVAVPVNAIINISPNDEILISMQSTSSTGSGVLDLCDDMTLTVVSPRTPSHCGDNGTTYLPGDISGPNNVPDCYVDFYDMEALVANWIQSQ